MGCQGVRVKNAIDTTQHPEWANEVLYNQGKLVVAYEYLQIDEHDPSGRTLS